MMQGRWRALGRPWREAPRLEARVGGWSSQLAAFVKPGASAPSLPVLVALFYFLEKVIFCCRSAPRVECYWTSLHCCQDVPHVETTAKCFAFARLFLGERVYNTLTPPHRFTITILLMFHKLDFAYLANA